MICQCLTDQLFASTFGFGKKLICLPQTNHDILLNLIQKLLIIKHTHRFHWVWNISISKEIIIPSSTIKIIVIIIIIIITTLEAIDKHHPAYKESHTIWLVAQGSDSFKLFKFHGFFHCPFPVFHDLKFSCHLQKNY